MSDQIPNYLKDMLKAQSQIPPGEVWETVIVHDDDCVHFDGGICNCNCEVVLMPVDLRFTGEELQA